MAFGQGFPVILFGGNFGGNLRCKILLCLYLADGSVTCLIVLLPPKKQRLAFGRPFLFGHRAHTMPKIVPDIQGRVGFWPSQERTLR
jgi:hypothetical protein